MDILVDNQKFRTEASAIELKVDDKTLFRFDGLDQERENQMEGSEIEKSFKAFTVQSLSQAVNSAFGHPHRFRIVMSLRSSSGTFTELKRLLGVSSPTVNYHLDKLVKGWIVSKDKEEKYTLTILGEFILKFFSQFMEEAEKLQKVIM